MRLDIKENRIPKNLITLLEKSDLTNEQKRLWRLFAMSMDDNQLKNLETLLDTDKSAFDTLTQKIKENQVS